MTGREAAVLTHELGHGWGMTRGTSLPSKELRLNYGYVDRKTGNVTSGNGRGHIGETGHPGNAQIPGDDGIGWNTTVHGQMSGGFDHRGAGGAGTAYRTLCP